METIAIEREQVLKVLEDAQALVSRGWTQRAEARDVNGQSVPPQSPTACCWCVMGALKAAGKVDSRAFFPTAYFALVSAAGVTCLSIWNDRPGCSQTTVLALFDHAIARVKEAP